MLLPLSFSYSCVQSIFFSLLSLFSLFFYFSSCSCLVGTGPRSPLFVGERKKVGLCGAIKKEALIELLGNCAVLVVNKKPVAFGGLFITSVDSAHLMSSKNTARYWAVCARRRRNRIAIFPIHFHIFLLFLSCYLQFFIALYNNTKKSKRQAEGQKGLFACPVQGKRGVPVGSENLFLFFSPPKESVEHMPQRPTHKTRQGDPPYASKGREKMKRLHLLHFPDRACWVGL